KCFLQLLGAATANGGGRKKHRRLLGRFGSEEESSSSQGVAPADFDAGDEGAAVGCGRKRRGRGSRKARKELAAAARTICGAEEFGGSRRSSTELGGTIRGEIQHGEWLEIDGGSVRGVRCRNRAISKKFGGLQNLGFVAGVSSAARKVDGEEG
ncbi:hypothetical protein LINGRAHAP2_LOCUS7319, partial [Linum grandiflorum]